MTDSQEQKTSPNLQFAELKLPEPLLDNLATLNYHEMTPIQAQSLPLMLQGLDVIAQARTGSGKTAAFGLALLSRIVVEKFVAQALVLCPTRELAEQVSQSIRQLARLIPNIKVLNLSGGVAMKPQLDSLRHGAHIIVGTPGRVQKHLDKKTLSLHKVTTLVLDEADRMLDMGFYDAIKAIILLCPKERQTLLFSATYPLAIKKLAQSFMRNAQHVVAEGVEDEIDIDQVFYQLKSARDKFPLLKKLLLHHQPAGTLIFCNTKEQTAQLTEQLNKEGLNAIALNGDMDQPERDLAMIRFKNKSCSIMVATDVAARGLDIKELPAVISYDLAFEHDVHVHRIGRTGRAGSKGLAIAFAIPVDVERIDLIEEKMLQPIKWGKEASLVATKTALDSASMVTLCFNLGRKDKIRPGDILGALTKDADLPGDEVGKIDITALYSYVAIDQKSINKAARFFQEGKLKGRKVSVKIIK